MYYAFYDRSSKRLLITTKEISSDTYIMLIKSTYREICQIYCVGFIDASNSSIKVINSREEFI